LRIHHPPDPLTISRGRERERELKPYPPWLGPGPRRGAYRSSCHITLDWSPPPWLGPGPRRGAYRSCSHITLDWGPPPWLGPGPRRGAYRSSCHIPLDWGHPPWLGPGPRRGAYRSHIPLDWGHILAIRIRGGGALPSAFPPRPPSLPPKPATVGGARPLRTLPSPPPFDGLSGAEDRQLRRLSVLLDPRIDFSPLWKILDSQTWRAIAPCLCCKGPVKRKRPGSSLLCCHLFCLRSHFGSSSRRCCLLLLKAKRRSRGLEGFEGHEPC
jgi:hypothetical protein